MTSSHWRTSKAGIDKRRRALHVLVYFADKITARGFEINEQALIADTESDMAERLVEQLKAHSGDASAVLVVDQGKTVQARGDRPFVVHGKSAIKSKYRKRCGHSFGL